MQVERQRDGVRRITQVTEVCGLEGEVITMNDIASFVFDREDAQGRIIGHYQSGAMRPKFFDRLEYFGMDRAWLQAEQSLVAGTGQAA